MVQSLLVGSRSQRSLCDALVRKMSKRTNMKKKRSYLTTTRTLLAVSFITAPVASTVVAQTSTVDCPSLYQSWVLNVLREDTCGFGGMLRYRLGTLVKNACDAQLSEEAREKLGMAV